MWIEVHQGIFRHRKVVTLAGLLGVNRLQAGAHVISLWLWAVDNAEDGDLTGIGPAAIAVGAEWDGDPDRFLESLAASGFVDQDADGERRYLHDWEEYAGRLVQQRQQKRQQNRERQARFRRNALLTRYVTRDVTVMSRVSNAPTIPNRTIPYYTPPVGGGMGEPPSEEQASSSVGHSMTDTGTSPPENSQGTTLSASQKEGTGQAPEATSSRPAWQPPDWWLPLMELPGYVRRDYSRTAQSIMQVCQAHGADVAQVVQGFAAYYVTNRFRWGWTNPVAALRNDKVLTIQIKKTLGGNTESSRSPPRRAEPKRDWQEYSDQF